MTDKALEAAPLIIILAVAWCAASALTYSLGLAVTKQPRAAYAAMIAAAEESKP